VKAVTGTLPATTLRAWEAFLEVPDKHYYQVEIARRVGLPSSAVAEDLVRLVHLGWVQTGLNALPSPGSRCRRRWYKLTDEGGRAADQQPAPRRRQRRDDRAGWRRQPWRGRAR
jgi:hypothetical protein